MQEPPVFDASQEGASKLEKPENFDYIPNIQLMLDDDLADENKVFR